MAVIAGGDIVYADFINSWQDAIKSNGIVSGCALSLSGGTILYVGSGYYVQGGVVRQFAGSYFDVGAINAGSSHIDLVTFSGAIVVQTAGTLVAGGTGSGVNPPAIPSGNTLIGWGASPSGAAAVTVVDARVTVNSFFNIGDAIPTAGATDTILHVFPDNHSFSGTMWVPATGSPYGFYGQKLPYVTSDEPTRIKDSHPQVLMNAAGSMYARAGTNGYWFSGTNFAAQATNVHLRSFGGINRAFGAGSIVVSGVGMASAVDGDTTTAGSVTNPGTTKMISGGAWDLGANYVPTKIMARVNHFANSANGSSWVTYSGAGTAETVLALAGHSSIGNPSNTTVDGIVFNPGSVRYFFFYVSGAGTGPDVCSVYEIAAWV